MLKLVIEGVDSQWKKMDRGVSSVAEGRNLDFGGDRILSISECYVSNR